MSTDWLTLTALDALRSRSFSLGKRPCGMRAMILSSWTVWLTGFLGTGAFSSAALAPAIHFARLTFSHFYSGLLLRSHSLRFCLACPSRGRSRRSGGDLGG